MIIIKILVNHFYDFHKIFSRGWVGSKKVDIQEKQAMWNTASPKNQLFPKSNSSEKFDAVQNYLVQKSTSPENV